MAKERSGIGRAGTGAAVVVLVLAALLGGRYGLGLGGGKGGEGALPESGNTVQGEVTEATAAPEAAEQESNGEEADDGTITVTVREDRLFYGDREVDLSALEEALLRDYVPGTTAVKLIDDHAIKSAYDEVAALLDRLGIEAG